MELKCPICESSLPDDKYNLAKQKLNEETIKINSELQNEIKRIKNENSEIEKKFESKIQFIKENEESKFKSIEKELEKSYNKQLETIEKSNSRNYNELMERHSAELRNLEYTLQTAYKNNLNSKELIIKKLEQERQEYQKQAYENAKIQTQHELDKLRNDLLQRDIQINRFKEEVEDLKKQVIQSQAELKGEAGEIDLFAKLTEAFPDDHFRRQTRGKSTGDIIQEIRYNGKLIDIPIVYDNKEVESISINDINKAKKYQQIHATKYVILVSSKLPKRDVKSGLLGEKDGIYLVHPSIIVPFIFYLRKAIIELSLLSKSEKERESKEAVLYEYIRSHEFRAQMEFISKTHFKLWQLQDKEEKEHEKTWKDRKQHYKQLERYQSEISLKIQSILSMEYQKIEAGITSKQNTKLFQ
jgi:hypothetical protein